MRLPSPRTPLAAALLLSLASAGCQTTRASDRVEPSGFLVDYSNLEEGGRGEASLVYINPAAEWQRYNSVILDSVTLWYTAEEKLSPQEAQRLTDTLYQALHKELEAKGYSIVTVPGPHVLRLRAAITEARGARVVANAVTSIVPQLRLATTVIGFTTDTAVFVGKASVEGEIIDSLSNVRLAAGVDRRVGAKTLRAFGEWSQVEDAFEVWAERIASRLAELRAGGKKE